MIRKTPLVAAPALDGKAGGRVFLKLENLQRTGSFKLRGAERAIDALSAEARGRGIVAASAGNHGAGLALAGRKAGVSVTVFVPAGTPQIKLERMAAEGARVKICGARYEEAELAAKTLAAECGAFFVSAYDDDAVIFGNGSLLARELADQCEEIRRVLAPVGGGGLIGGLAAVFAPRGIELVGVQPASQCAMRESLAAGRALLDYRGGETLAEGCEGGVSERTYRLVRDHRVATALVSESDIRRAVRYAYEEIGTVVEPTGAVALAALLSGRAAPAIGGATIAIVTGGNIDDDTLDALLASPDVPRGAGG